MSLSTDIPTRLCIFSVAAGIVAYLLFSPGFANFSTLDDFASLQKLVMNRNLLHSDFSRYLLDESGPTGRPVSMMSFMLQLVVGDAENIYSKFKLVNFMLHWVNFSLVLVLMYRLAGLSARVTKKTIGALFLFSWFWFLNPIWLSTVLYSVQRMTILASLFSLAALITYLFVRSALLEGAYRRVLYLSCLFGVFWLTAGFSKENGFLVLFSIPILEVAVNQGESDRERSLLWMAKVALMLSCLLFFIGFLFSLEELAHRYQNREFDMQQRLCVQPSIVVSYIRDFFWFVDSYPTTFHDDLGVSDFCRQQTLVRLIGFFCFIAIPLTLIILLFRYRGLFLGSFTLFLFFHALESSFIPLELKFDHRNYLPSVFLLWPLVQLFARLSRGAMMAVGLPLAFAVTMIFVSQIANWSSALVFSNYVTKISPESARAQLFLSETASNYGDFDLALVASKRANEINTREGEWDFRIRNAVLVCGAPVDDFESFKLPLFDRDSITDGYSLRAFMYRLSQMECSKEFVERWLFENGEYVSDAIALAQLHPDVLTQVNLVYLLALQKEYFALK